MYDSCRADLHSPLQICFSAIILKPSVFEYVCNIVLGQGADGRFRLDDPLVDQLLLQVSPRQAPQVVHLVDGALRQVILIII